MLDNEALKIVAEEIINPSECRLPLLATSRSVLHYAA